jgi:hypothetical protein
MRGSLEAGLKACATSGRKACTTSGLKVCAVSAVLLVVLVGSGCQASDPTAPAMLTPTLTLSRQNVPLGTPIEMTYRFVVAKDAKFTTNYHVMVHFGDQQDEQLMYTDDHDPPTPTTTWKPGQTIEYTRTFFTPTYPYIGAATVEIGLYAPGEKLRVPMAAEDTGHRSYKVATFELQPQTEGVQTIYKEGFHPVEGATGNGVGWHWTKKEATLVVAKNPKKDCVFYLDVDNPSELMDGPQTVSLSLGSTMLDEFSVTPTKSAVLRKIPITASAWGAGDNIELKIAVDKIFVPSALSQSTHDSRELGIRVLHAAVVPK